MWGLESAGSLPIPIARVETGWIGTFRTRTGRGSSATIAEAVQAKGLFELEHRVKRTDGSWAWMHSRAVPLLDDQGTITEWFGASRDVTLRREAEETLRDSDRRKNEFLATLAHELRNPLAPLRNGLHIAKKDCNPGSPFQRTIEMMERQLNHLVHLVDDLMDVGRISTGKIELRRERVRLREVLADSVEACRGAIDHHAHTLIVEAGADDLCVAGDFDRLAQVFSNLLSNSAKYTERGGRIELRLTQEGNEAVVCVSDTGIGIQASDLPGLFEMFAQVSEHRSRAQGGLGIGLSLVRKLVELHAGSVSANSPGPGRGSNFVVRLPLIQPLPAHQHQERREPVVPPHSPHRILVVDDNIDAATSLATLLKGLGHDVDTAFGGHEGIAKAEAMRPDLIFLDLGMPRMNGIDAAKRLRKLPHGQEIKLVALTGWGQELDRQRTTAAGFDEHLLKPIDPAELARLLAAPAPNPLSKSARGAV